MKPEMWPLRQEEVHCGGEGPHWAVVPTKEIKKKISLRIILNISVF